MKRHGRALQRQPAALMAATHTGADAEEHTTAGKGHPVVAVAHLVSPRALNSAPAAASLAFPGTARGHRAAVLPPSTPSPGELSHWLKTQPYSVSTNMEALQDTDSPPYTVTSFTLAQYNH